MTLAEALAARIAATDFDAITPQALHYARIGVLDTLAVGIAGAGEEAVSIAQRVTGAAGGRRGRRARCRIHQRHCGQRARL